MWILFKKGKKIFAIIAVVLSLMCWIYSQEQVGKKKQFSDYSEMRAYVGELYRQKNYKEAVEILTDVLDQFPDHVHANSYNLALMLVHLEEFEKSIEVLNNALDRGVWFGKYDFLAELWNPIKELENYQKFNLRNEEQKKIAGKSAKPELFVFTPENFTKGKKYPLFIALHGGGGNVAEFKNNWFSEKMRSDFIAAFPQSSQLITMNGYNWTEDIELSKKEIQEAYLKVINEYPVDIDRVVIGGFSSGGVAALEVALNDIFPVRGFVVLCPAKPDGFSEEKVKAAKNRGVRGIILTTEMDNRLDAQKEMAEILKNTGFPHQFFVTPNIGHWFPDDMDQKIDEAIEFIFLKNM